MHTNNASSSDFTSLGARTGDTVLVTRTLGDHQVFRFEGTLECSSLTDGFAVTGEDVDTGFRTTGYFLNEDATLGTRQEVMLVARC